MHASRSHAPQATNTAFQQSWRACALVIVLTVAVALAIQLPSYLHQDVAFMTWTADQVMRGAVFGQNIYEINPPLNFMIYVPAALLGRIIGLDPAIKLWMVFVAAVSIYSVWRVAENSTRLHVIIMLGLFFALAFPGEFGQREQFTLLLCAPYVAGNSDRKGLGILNGILAGIGFALKPYFLVALVLVFATRRKVRTEEWSIAATGLCYAAALPLFFQPYLTEMLPRVMGIYWIHDLPVVDVLRFIMIVPALVTAMFLIAAPQRGVSGYAAAAIGFTIAVILHRKGYIYHYIPCFGFLALYLAALLKNDRRMARMAAVLFLALEVWRLGFLSNVSLSYMQERKRIVPVLLSAVESSRDFTFLSNYNFGAFPTAILTSKPFLGLSPLNNFISAVAVVETGLAQGDAREASRMAIDQAVRELERKPDLVIVATDWATRAGLKVPFDGLAWFDHDPAFHALWQDYYLAGQFDEYQFYRRK